MDERGFLINFGTEHNTPLLIPLTIVTSDAELDGYLQQVAFDGACVVAAHQYLRAKGEHGFVDENGLTKNKEKKEFSKLGKAVIEKYLKGN